MTIEIIEAELTEFEDDLFWDCWMEIGQQAEAYLLPATAPASLAQADLQAHFEAREAELFRLAQVNGIAVDEIYNRLPKRALRTALLMIMDEINILRGLHGLSERTPAQARTAFKNKLKSF